MSRFKFEEETTINYFSPQEMYIDYKKKKIKGIINYQSEMIDKYMNEGFYKKDVALELPTGSGKTLVGLLIGEFRRITEGERVVYVCPNNQLVNQVVDKAINEYGIDAVGFTGPKENYGSET